MTASPDSRWVVVRHRVSIAGCVTGVQGKPVSGGQLLLSAAQQAAPANAKRPAGKAGARAAEPAQAERPGRVFEAPIRSDGRYFFLDVPPGDYLLSGTDQQRHALQGRSVSVPMAVGERAPPVFGVDLVVLGSETSSPHGGP